MEYLTSVYEKLDEQLDRWKLGSVCVRRDRHVLLTPNNYTWNIECNAERLRVCPFLDPREYNLRTFSMTTISGFRGASHNMEPPWALSIS